MTEAAADITESVGDFFRQVRETKGLTLEEVALKTRIHLDYLRALEESNFTKLPDQVFAKGFVRSYARSLGLDEEDAMRRFTASSCTFYSKHEERERLRQQQVEDERKRQANRKVVVAGVGVAVLGLILLLTREQGAVSVMRPLVPAKTGREAERKSSREAGTSTEVSTKSGAIPALAGGTVGTAPTSATTSDPLAGLPLDGGAESENVLILALEATELSWVLVQTDNASPHEALMRPGDRLTWKANEKFSLTVGNAGGIRGELNGTPLAPFGPKGKAIRDIVVTR
ncbi:MAG: helix-turn-helix domain-containing protein [Nitrospira sp.]